MQLNGKLKRRPKLQVETVKNLYEDVKVVCLLFIAHLTDLLFQFLCGAAGVELKYVGNNQY